MKNIDKEFEELVIQLRQETGAGKIDCQKALITTYKHMVNYDCH